MGRGIGTVVGRYGSRWSLVRTSSRRYLRSGADFGGSVLRGYAKVGAADGSGGAGEMALRGSEGFRACSGGRSPIGGDKGVSSCAVVARMAPEAAA